LDPLGITPFEAIGRAARLEGADEVAAALPDVPSWTGERLEKVLADLRRLASAEESIARRFPDPAEHPWKGSRLEELGYQTSVEIREALADARPALDELIRASRSVAERSASAEPRTLEDADRALDLLRLLIESPRPSAENLADPAWRARAGEVDEIIERCRRHREEMRSLEARWSPALIDDDHEALLAGPCCRSGALRFLRPSWWRQRRSLRERLAPGARLPRRELLIEDLGRARRAKDLRAAIAADAQRAAFLFESLWKGEESDAEGLAGFADWVRRIAPHLEGEGAEARRRLASSGLSDPRAAEAAARDIVERRKVFADAWKRLLEAARMEEEEALGGPLESRPLEPLAGRLRRMEEEVEALNDWGRKVAPERSLAEEGLAPFLDRARQKGVQPSRLPDAFERHFLRAWLDHACSQRESLRRFHREDHELAIREFRRLDLRQLRFARRRLRKLLMERLPDPLWESSARSELGILQREVRRKRGHLPLRKLFGLLPGVLSRLKPCFLMSPLSVAQFIDPRSLRFDVVIFDEASQIAPEDAVGAIGRADQLVVVGDSRQLPPTAFFQKQESGVDPLLEDEEEAPDLESILDECVAAGLPRSMLRWHYRSRHESLIRFSNRHFYDERLLTFPSPQGEEPGAGVSFVHVPGGRYGRGASRTNEVEADRVARAVIEHLRSRPDLSLGVGTFTQAQQIAILDRLEELRREDESLEAQFSADRDEHFFVKNLENIQGDERDVIFISVGYARDASGKLFMSFGPLNSAGGERRLNVLVTRARRRLVVFSSIRSEDIRVAESTAPGRRLLKEYLEYAESAARSPEPGRRAAGGGDGGSSLFAEAVASRLAAEGFAVQLDVGWSRLRIDLALGEAASPGKHLLGIDWDGRSYQAPLTARDRDRLRTQVLEGLGWNLHRIWAAEWLRDPRAELERVREAVEAVRRGETRREVLDLIAEVDRESDGRRGPRRRGGARRGAEPAPARTQAVAYRLARLEPVGSPDDFEDAPKRDVAARLAKVVESEAPIHRDEAARRVAGAWGITRLSQAVLERVGEAIDATIARGRARLDEAGFLWRPDAPSAVPRVREEEGCPRDPELIPLEELAAGARMVLEREYRLPREDLLVQTARLLGFARTGARLRERAAEALDLLIREGDAVEDGTGVRRPDDRPAA
ncbi:MAG: DUF3320 domain-containing protein, partial [Planctomycetes bacterium]|nr:DUF3320 domain-containing protein [Planctomycetota bacterium]